VRIDKRVLFLLITLVFTNLSLLKAQIDVSMFVDTNHIRIGEQIDVKLIIINHTEDKLEITWPFAMDTLSKSIEVIELLPVDTQKYEEETLFIQEWQLTSFDTGFHYIPPFEIIINGDQKVTDPYLIQVETVAIDTTLAIKDIKGVQDVPISILEWIEYHWKWFAGLAVLGILIFGIYIIIKNKNKELDLSEQQVLPLIPPFQLAIERLEKLRDGKWWQQGDVKYYHAAISEILREYLEHEYDFPALEQTTREVMRSIRLTPIESGQQKHLNRILLLSDLVKYAKEKPLAKENEEMLELALEFVQKTKVIQKVEPETKELRDEA
jgi:hypothetical protein